MAIPVASAHLNDMDAMRKAIVASSPVRPDAPRFPDGPPDMLLPFPLVKPPAAPVGDLPQPIRMERMGDRLEFYNSLIQEDAFFPWLRRLILEHRQWVSERTGIESLSYLPELSKGDGSGVTEDPTASHTACCQHTEGQDDRH